LTNRTVQDAVVRRLEIIWEATKNLPKSFKKNYPDIEWRKVAGLRDVIVHEYFGLSLKLIRRIVQNNIPELKKQVSKILGSLEKSANIA
jgi:uncharacterized protein with HEPN domain